MAGCRWAHELDLRFGYTLEVSAPCARHNWQFSLCQFRPQMLGLGAEQNLLERILVQVPHVTRTIVILAVAGDRQIAVDGNIVFGFAGERRAIETLATEPG